MKRLFYQKMLVTLWLAGCGILSMAQQNVTAPTGYLNGYGFVDLGLKSGIQWAVCNVGAGKPTESGNYFAWGETSPKTDYSWSTLQYGDGDHFTKYNVFEAAGPVDNKTELDRSDDAASANMGRGWRMPTMSEVSELMDCKWTEVKVDGVAGYLVTGPNGNTIFIPDVGVYDGTEKDGSLGLYWTSTLVAFFIPDNILDKPKEAPLKAYAYAMSPISMYVGVERKTGLPVRPVCFAGDIPAKVEDYCSDAVLNEYWDSRIKTRDVEWMGYEHGFFLYNQPKYVRNHGNSIRKDQYFGINLKGNTTGPFTTEKKLKKAVKSIRQPSPAEESKVAEELQRISLHQEFAAMLFNLKASRETRQHATSLKRSTPLSIVREGDYYGLITQTGIYLLEPVYDYIYSGGSDESKITFPYVLGFKKNTSYQLISFAGKMISPEKGVWYSTPDGIKQNKDGKYVYSVKGTRDGKSESYFLDPPTTTDSFKDFYEQVVTVNKKMWENKDEFETKADYQKRMSYPYYGMALGYYAAEALVLYGQLYSKAIMTLAPYDIEHETFLVKTLIGDIPLKVPEKESMQFRKAWESGRVKLESLDVRFEKGSLVLKRISCVSYEKSGGKYDSYTSYWAHCSDGQMYYRGWRYERPKRFEGEYDLVYRAD